ncbi:MAG: hypothetical protein C5B51_01930 [Terriglobia bacterium]|nr:MAG: hypothetical protein C5B51_01930 [Terriglobia bacterium]
MFRLKTIAFSLIIGLGCVILFFGLDFAYTSLVIPHDTREPGIRHPVYHHSFRPYFDAVRGWGGRKYRFVTNSLGFADSVPREIPLQTSKRRILFLGDSFTEGIGYTYPETFVGRFSAMLDPDQYDVLNGAVASYSPRWYYRKLKYHLDRGLKVDEVFVFIDISDVQDEVFYAHERWRDVALPYIRSSMERRFLLTLTAMRLFRSRLSPPPIDYANRANWTSNEDVFQTWGEEGLNLATQHMDQIAELCRLRGIRLFVAVYPWPAQITRGERECRQVTHWREFCRSRQVPFLDLFSVFIDPSVPDAVTRYYIPGDFHWNTAGNEKVADALHSFWLETSRAIHH